MPIVAELVDAVVGGDTHRDTHTLEMLTPVGGSISSLTIDNTEAGFATAIAWLVDNAPGSRVVIGLEGTRSFGIGLARALVAAGFTVVEVERSLRAKRRRANPTRSTPAALPNTCCGWTPIGCRHHVPTVTGKPCEYWSRRVRRSP